jgi:hypothetical protein
MDTVDGHRRGSRFTVGSGRISRSASAAASPSTPPNPDFSPVETDPAVLNLSTFGILSGEASLHRRMQIILSTIGDDGGPGMFYSRRIGRGDPDKAMEDGDEQVESVHST